MPSTLPARFKPALVAVPPSPQVGVFDGSQADPALTGDVYPAIGVPRLPSTRTICCALPTATNTVPLGATPSPTGKKRSETKVVIVLEPSTLRSAPGLL